MDYKIGKIIGCRSEQIDNEMKEPKAFNIEHIKGSIFKKLGQTVLLAFERNLQGCYRLFFWNNSVYSNCPNWFLHCTVYSLKMGALKTMTYIFKNPHFFA